MDSLKSVYNAIAEQDFEKAAQAQIVEDYGPSFADADPELVKQAADYDHIGRILAHSVFTDLVKEAMDEEMPNASEDEKKKVTNKIVAKAKGEKSEDDDDDEYKEKMKKDDKKEDESEKTAAYRQAVLQRMYEDPEYVQALIAKHF